MTWSSGSAASGRRAAAACAARPTAAPNSAAVEVVVVDPDALAERDAGAATGRRRCAGRGGRGSPRSSASSRTCRWCRRRGSTRNASLGMAERGHQPAHAVQAEAHAEQLQRAAALGPAGHRASGRVRVISHGRPQASGRSRSRAPACRARPATTCGRRLGDERPRWRACARRARSRPRACGGARRRACAAASTSSSSPARISTVPPGIGTEATGVARPSASPSSVKPGQPGDVLGRLLVARRLQLRRARRAGLDPAQVAPAPQRLDRRDRALHCGLGRRVDLDADRRAAHAARPAAPRRRGCASRSPRSRTGSAGAPSATVSVSTCSSVADQLGLAGAQPRLDQLQVPVAQLAVDEVVEAERGVGEVKALDRRPTARPGRAPGARGSSGPRPRSAWPPHGRRPSPPTPSRISRAAFHSLLVSCWPWATLSSEKRTSWPEDIASRPQRTASAP